MHHYTQYLHYHVGLLKEFKASVQEHFPFNKPTEDIGEQDKLFIHTLDSLSQTEHYSETIGEQGQWLITHIVSTYSQFMPLLPRDLLWFFGGDCLHYMPDEEITFYQQLDELRFTAEEQNKTFDYAAAKRSLSTSN